MCWLMAHRWVVDSVERWRNVHNAELSPVTGAEATVRVEEGGGDVMWPYMKLFLDDNADQSRDPAGPLAGSYKLPGHTVNSQCRVEVVRHQAWPQRGLWLPNEKGIYHRTVIRHGYYCCCPPPLPPSFFSPSSYLMHNLFLFIWVFPTTLFPLPPSSFPSCCLLSSFILMS